MSRWGDYDAFCAVCDEKHIVIGQFGGMDIIACDAVPEGDWEPR